MNIRKNLLSEIQAIICASRGAAVRSVDHHRVRMYGSIGQKIFGEKQEAKERATYGTYLIKTISKELQPFYGSSFSMRPLERYRQFYPTFSIASVLRTQLNWTHYKRLMSIDREPKRDFYIAEAEKNKWTARQLERRVNSQLFEQLLVSKDLESVLAVACNKNQPDDGRHISKDQWCGKKKEQKNKE